MTKNIETDTNRDNELNHTGRRILAGLALSATAVAGYAGYEAMSNTEQPTMVDYTFENDDTISGVVEEMNPEASPAELSTITEDTLVDNNLVGHAGGVQAGSELKIPVYPEYAQSDSKD